MYIGRMWQNKTLLETDNETNSGRSPEEEGSIVRNYGITIISQSPTNEYLINGH